MTDEQLLELSRDVDNILIQLATKYETPALLLSAVMLARIVLLCDECGASDDIRKLLISVSETPLGKEIEVLH